MDSKLLILALKQVLKDKDLTYAELASELDISEVSVKRLFSTGNCTLDRLDQICNIIHISISDLIKWMDQQHERTFCLTIENEDIFTNNIALYEFWQDLRSPHIKIESLIEKYKLSKRSLRLNLSQLENMNLLEVHPYDRVKHKVHGTLNLLENGPLQKKLSRSLIIEFIDRIGGKYNEEEQAFTMSHRRVSRETLKIFAKKIHQNFQEFRDISYREEKILSSDQLVKVQWLGGIVPCE